MKTLSLNGYAQLRSRVQRILVAGREHLEREKVKIYWETGREIGQYVGKANYQGHEDYGQQVVLRLAKDLNLSDSLLYRTVRFYDTFPRLATWPNLTWSHYRPLLTIESDEKRRGLAQKANRLKWKVRDLQKKINQIKANDRAKKLSSKYDFTPLTPKRGSLNLYRIKEDQIDWGFEAYKDLSAAQEKRFKDGSIVRVGPETDATGIKRTPNKTSKDLFTYRAKVLKVVDGDTLRVMIDLGFGMRTRQYLRLRGINTPELKTQRGQNALAFVKRELAKSPTILIRTEFSDKYDRYLTDVFYGPGETQFLNNVLLAQHLAHRA